MAQSKPTMRKAGPQDREFAYRVRKSSFHDYVEKVEGWDEAYERLGFRRTGETETHHLMELS
jgi:hypothetical protein